MPDGDEPIRIDIVSDLGTVARDEWDACAGPDTPFVERVDDIDLAAAGRVQPLAADQQAGPDMRRRGTVDRGQGRLPGSGRARFRSRRD